MYITIQRFFISIQYTHSGSFDSTGSLSHEQQQINKNNIINNFDNMTHKKGHPSIMFIQIQSMYKRSSGTSTNTSFFFARVTATYFKFIS